MNENVTASKAEVNSRWCLVGNIVTCHEYGEDQQIKYGTKQFSGGTKVYIAPAQWGDGYEKVVVIGISRKVRHYIEVIINRRYIENYRLERVYKPSILQRMLESTYRWWDDTEQGRDNIIETAEFWNMVSQNFPENFQRMQCYTHDGIIEIESPRWQQYYQSAPTEPCRLYIEMQFNLWETPQVSYQSFIGSSDQADSNERYIEFEKYAREAREQIQKDILRKMHEMESILCLDDWRYLSEFAGHGQFGQKCMKYISELPEIGFVAKEIPEEMRYGNVFCKQPQEQNTGTILT